MPGVLRQVEEKGDGGSRASRGERGWGSLRQVKEKGDGGLSDK